MKKIVFFFLMAAGFLSLYGQTATKMSEIISREEMTYGDISYFLSIQAGLCDDQVSEKDAFNALYQAGYFPESFDIAADTEKESSIEEIISQNIKLKDLALLCTKSYGIKGGILYRLTKAPRYALRELKAKGFVQNDAEPDSTVSGKTFLGILSGIEDEKALNREGSDE